MEEYGFESVLLQDTPLSYMEIKDLIEFFKAKGHLEKAIIIYNTEGFVSLMEYKGRLIKGVKDWRKTDIKAFNTSIDDYHKKQADLKIKSDKEQSIVAFCMRCFGNSAVAVDETTNFCHNCGSMGTCIAIKKDESEYLRMNIQNAVNKERYN